MIGLSSANRTSEQEPRNIDAYWRVANYLAIGQVHSCASRNLAACGGRGDG